MKKFKPWILPAAVALCLVLFVIYCIHAKVTQDHVPPVISMDTDVISLSVYDDPDALLAGVTAKDKQDGDVTDLLVVEGVSAISSEYRTTVTYAAFDRAGNVSKAQRTIVYTDYEGPKFALSSALVFRSGTYIDLYDYITASDPIDGDLSGQIKASLVDGEHDLSETGTHLVELRVTNSMGETARLTVPVQVYSASDYNASLFLTDYLVYLEKGQHFDSGIYLGSLYAGGRMISKGELTKSDAAIDMTSDIQPDVPGTYHVNYTVSWNGYKGCTQLIVVVEE